MATAGFLDNSFFNDCSAIWYKIQQNALCACVINKARLLAGTSEHLRKRLVHHRLSRFLRTHVKNLTLSVLELDNRAAVMKANHPHYISDPVSIKTTKSCHYQLVQTTHFNLFTKQRLPRKQWIAIRFTSKAQHEFIGNNNNTKTNTNKRGGGRKCQKRHKKNLETSHVFQFFLFYLLGFGTGDNLYLVLMEKNISFFVHSSEMKRTCKTAEQNIQEQNK